MFSSIGNTCSWCKITISCKYMRKEAPKNETPRDRFKRLATDRTNTILQRIKILGNCSNRQAYEYTEEEINKIFSEIDRAVKETKMKFHFSSKKREFKL